MRSRSKAESAHRTRAQRRGLTFLGSLLLGAATAVASPGRYMEKDEFLQSAFPDREPAKVTLWVTEDVRQSVERVIGRRFPMLRVHYWEHGGRTAWIFDEIGKDEPITIGVTIENGAVGMVRVLEFRESRGWEIRYPFFTDQFRGARLTSGHRISKQVDGITGATLSVGAVGRVVRLALLLHERAEGPNAS